MERGERFQGCGSLDCVHYGAAAGLWQLSGVRTVGWDALADELCCSYINHLLVFRFFGFDAVRVQRSIRVGGLDLTHDLLVNEISRDFAVEVARNVESGRGGFLVGTDRGQVWALFLLLCADYRYGVLGRETELLGDPIDLAFKLANLLFEHLV